MTQIDNILQAVDLRVTLDGREILRDLAFQIPAGVWVGIIGPNGAGKTTLLKAIGGLVPYDGSLLLNDRQVSQWNRSRFARKVAVVRPPAALAFDFRVSELVLLSRASRKKWLERFNDYDRRIVDRALASVDLANFGDRSIHTLSSGEQQRVFLAQALAQEPEVLLLDEPTSHLDIQHQFSFLDRVRTFVDQGGTALAVIHDLELASRFADYLMVVHHGAIVGFGKPAQVLTEAVIEGVFKMRAQVTAAGESIEDIRYVERSNTP